MFETVKRKIALVGVGLVGAVGSVMADNNTTATGIFGTLDVNSLIQYIILAVIVVGVLWAITKFFKK